MPSEEDRLRMSEIEAWARSVLAEEVLRLREENLMLRRLVAAGHSDFRRLYTDDGEMIDASERPVIDYLNDSPETISEALYERASRRSQG